VDFHQGLWIGWNLRYAEVIMAKKNEDNERWAVENTNLDTGETVRYMETSQDFVAKTLSDKANERFKEQGVNCVSKIIAI
jgi:hypothetical protein